MPGAVPRTSTFALTNATFGYLQEICDQGVEPALRSNRALGRAVLCYRGQVTHRALAEAQDRPLVSAPW
jgi:alanine dehydrogenase